MENLVGIVTKFGALAQMVERTFRTYTPHQDQFRKPTIGADGKSGRNCYQIRGISTDGSARHSHCRGQGFDSPMLHKKTLQIKVCKVFSCSFFSHSECADTAQLPLVYYSRVFFCRVRSLPSVSAGPYTPGEYSANSTINNTVQPCNRLWRLHCNSMSGLKTDFSACRHLHGSRR